MAPMAWLDETRLDKRKVVRSIPDVWVLFFIISSSCLATLIETYMDVSQMFHTSFALALASRLGLKHTWMFHPWMFHTSFALAKNPLTFASRLGLKHTWMFHTHGCLTHHKLWPAKPFDIRWHSLRCLLVPSYPNNLNMKWWGKKVVFIISQYHDRTWNWGFHVNTRSAPLREWKQYH